MLLRDLQSSIRSLRRVPGFVTVIVGSLALGIGGTTTIFSLVDALLLRPPNGVTSPEELVGIYTSHASGRQHFYTSYPDYAAMREQIDCLVDATAFAFAELSLGTDGGSQLVPGEMVSANFFEVLGVQPSLGRTFNKEETRVGTAQRVAVISHALWRRQLGADPQVVGSTIRLEGQPFTVIGVAPKGFTSRVGPLEAGVWYPIGIPGRFSGYTVDQLGLRYRDDFSIIGRLRPARTVGQCQAQLDLVASRLDAEFPDSWRADDGGHRRISVVAHIMAGVPPQILPRGAIMGFAALLMVVVGLTLFAACCNSASLMLARGLTRTRETAVRMALGASRRRIVVHLLTESLLLAGAGGLAGLLIAYWATGALELIDVPPMPVRLVLPLDERIFAFTSAVTLSSALTFGVVPALRASALGLSATLKDNPSTQGNRVRRFSLRNAIVVTQVAVSLALVGAAGQVLLGLRTADGVDIGFEPGAVLALPINPDPLELTDGEIRALYGRVLERLQAQPGVRAVSLAAQVPLTGSTSGASVMIPGTDENTLARSNVVAPGYFEMLQVSLFSGRTFDPGDSAGTAAVVVVNQTLASRLWPGQAAVGNFVKLSGSSDPARVIGVVGNGKYLTLDEEPRPHYWVPFAQSPRAQMIAHIDPRSGGRIDAAALLRAARVEEELIVVQPARIETLIGSALLPQQVAGAALVAAAALAIFLAIVGLYGILAQAVLLRRRELAIRMALGAAPTALMRAVVGEGLALTLVGVGLGGALLMSGNGLIEAQAGEGAGASSLVLLTVAGFLLLVSVAASWLPARRAASINPAKQLQG